MRPETLGRAQSPRGHWRWRRSTWCGCRHCRPALDDDERYAGADGGNGEAMAKPLRAGRNPYGRAELDNPGRVAGTRDRMAAVDRRIVSPLLVDPLRGHLIDRSARSFDLNEDLGHECVIGGLGLFVKPVRSLGDAPIAHQSGKVAPVRLQMNRIQRLIGLTRLSGQRNA